MVAVEVVLIIIGVIFLIGSFFVSEKLSQQDLDRISLMSQTDLKNIADKQLKEIKQVLDNSVDEMVSESLEITKRGLERETNKKIMAVSEYSDTVMEAINKNHNEVMFLYTMLNDKHAETAELIVNLQKNMKEAHELEAKISVAAANAAMGAAVENAATAEAAPPKKKRGRKKASEKAAAKPELIQEEPVKEDSLLNKNDQILLLYKEGKDEVEIAKALDCGLGEVRLVLGLYHET